MLHILAHDTPSGKHDNWLRLDPKLYGPPYASGRVFELAPWQRRFAVAAAGIASYDPAFDPEPWDATERGGRKHVCQPIISSESQPILSRFSVRSHTALLDILVNRARPDRKGTKQGRYRVN
jgi:hypothetical protein